MLLFMHRLGLCNLLRLMDGVSSIKPFGLRDLDALCCSVLTAYWPWFSHWRCQTNANVIWCHESLESLNAQMHHLRLIFEKASMNPISCSFDFLFWSWSCGSRSVHHLATRCTLGLDSHPFRRESDLWAHTSEKCPRFASRWRIQDVVEQFSSEKNSSLSSIVLVGW